MRGAGASFTPGIRAPTGPPTRLRKPGGGGSRCRNRHQGAGKAVCYISRYYIPGFDLFLIVLEWDWEVVFESGIAFILIVQA